MAVRQNNFDQPAPWAGRKMSTNWENLRRKSVDRVRLIRGKYLCLVTGAGDGLGRAIAGLVFQDQGIFPNAMSGSKVILVDKDVEDLKETSGKKMRQFLMHRKINVALEFFDVSILSEAKELLQKVIVQNDNDYEHVILINNASYIGDVSKKLVDLKETTEIEKFWDVNITSRIYLTSQFCEAYPLSKKTVVHTAYYDSAQPTPNLGLSCMATSAMDTFGKIFAKENPSIRVVLYTPSRMDDKRTKYILENCANEELKNTIARQCELNNLLQPLEAAKRMTRILEEYEFKAGEVVSGNDRNNNAL